MADLADTIFNTVKFINNGEKQVQDRVLAKQTMQANAQTIEKNKRILDVERDKDLGVRMDGSFAPFMKMGDPLDPTQDAYSFDLIGAYEKDPALAAEFLETLPAGIFNSTDEKGNRIKVKPTGIQKVKMPDGSDAYSITVTRPDGKKAPMTKRGTSAPDDTVITMSAKELDNLATQRLTSMFGNGAMDNSVGFLRGMAQIQDAGARDKAILEQSIRDEMFQLIKDEGADPEMAREMLAGLSSMDLEQLAAEAETMGFDVQGIFKDAEERIAQLDTKLGAAGADGTATAEEKAKASTGLVDALANVAEKVPGPMSNIAGLSAVEAGLKIGSLPTSEGAKAASSSLHKAIFGEELSGKLASAGEDTASVLQTVSDVASKLPGPAGQPLADTTRAAAAAREALKPPASGTVEPSNPSNSKWLVNLVDRAKGVIPPNAKESSITPDTGKLPEPVQAAMFDTTLSPEQRREAILGAIGDGMAAPSDQQVGYVRDYMINNGYTTPQALMKAPPSEVMNIAMVMAAKTAGTFEDRAKVAQSIMNFANFGDFTMSPKDAATIANMSDDNDLAAQRLAFDQGKEATDAATKASDEMVKFTTEADKDVDAVILSVPRDDKGFIKGRPTREGRDAIQRLTRRIKNARDIKNQPMYDANNRALAQAMPEYLSAQLIGMSGPIWDNITPINAVMDLFARAPVRQMNSDFGSIIIEYGEDGVTPKRFAIQTPKGAKGEMTITNATAVQQLLGNELYDYLLKSAETASELKKAARE